MRRRLLSNTQNPRLRTISYLPGTVSDQELENLKTDILAFATARKLPPVVWVEEKAPGVKSWQNRNIAGVVSGMSAGEWLVVSEVTHLGRSTLDILQILAELKQRSVNFQAIKGDWTLDGSIDVKVFLWLINLFTQIERDLVKTRTQKALMARKALGIRLGRPKGPGKSKLDQYRQDIEDLLKNGSTKAFIAKRYKVTEPTLFNWLKKHKIEIRPDFEPEVTAVKADSKPRRRRLLQSSRNPEEL